MAKQRVVVLGGSGMLGSMVVSVLREDPRLEVVGSVRSEALLTRCSAAVPDVEWRLFDGEGTRAEPNWSLLEGASWVINAIGITKPFIRDDSRVDVERAVRVNSLMPHQLAQRAASGGARVLQIATDCVYSGVRGGYTEADPHDALDVYGKSKSLGELLDDNAFNLRCSIIGPEPKEQRFLLDWFRSQPRGAHVTGFTNHLWNGVTTLHFARICHAVVTQEPHLPRLQHVIPTGVVSKAEMLSIFAEAYGRQDIEVEQKAVGQPLDRTLATSAPDVNRALWVAAGYADPPTVEQMVQELSAYHGTIWLGEERQLVGTGRAGANQRA